MRVIKVEIDGKPETLTNVSGTRYNTKGNTAQHHFGFHPIVGTKFRTMGHTYRILDENITVKDW